LKYFTSFLETHSDNYKDHLNFGDNLEDDLGQMEEIANFEPALDENEDH
jgi:hypothetical protein